MYRKIGYFLAVILLTGNVCFAENISLKKVDADAALSFDGNDYTLHSTTDIYTGDHSYVIKMRSTQTNSDYVGLIGKGYLEGNVSGSGLYYFNDSSKQIAFQARNSNDDIVHAKSTTVVNDGEWHYIIGTRNQTTGDIKIYIDGVLEGTGNKALTSFGGTKPLAIGARGGNLQYYFKGDISVAAVYTKALDQTEIDTIVSGTLTTDSLVSHWQASSLSTGATTWEDQVGTNDGTISGATVVYDNSKTITLRRRV